MGAGGLSRWLAIAAATMAATMASAADAGLGGRIAAVEADGAHLRATIRSGQVRGRTVHNLDTPARGQVREIARADGTVFAVTWHGRARPDLRQLLGDRFATMQAAPVIRRGVRLRAPLSLRLPGLVIRDVALPGGFSGYAYAPDLAPADFSADDLS